MHFLFFSHSTINGTISKKKSMQIKGEFEFSLQLLSKNISHSKKNSEISLKKSMPSCKVPVSLTRFKSNLNSDIFSKNRQISNFMKICPVAAKLLHVDRHT